MPKASKAFRLVEIEATESDEAAINHSIRAGSDAALRRGQPPFTTWVWHRSGRPKGLTEFFGADNGATCQVFLFSSPSSSVVRIDDGISGSQESRTWQFQLDQIPNAPGPDKSMARRSLQLRSLAGRIAAELEDDMVSPLLHLLPDPIYRYADRSIGILDGAAFAFLGGARAEFVMLIEAHSCGAGTPRWNVGIGQLTAWSSALTGAASQTVCAT